MIEDKQAAVWAGQCELFDDFLSWLNEVEGIDADGLWTRFIAERDAYDFELTCEEE